MMVSILAPSPRLTPFVSGYWMVEDWSGRFAGQPIRTSPLSGAVLSFNFGRPNVADTGQPVPAVSLLGVQQASRSWSSDVETRFVMVMLSLRGVARLFPGTGALTRGQLVDLAALEGSRATRLAHAAVTSHWSAAEVRACIERWLWQRLERLGEPRELDRLSFALRRLREGDEVEAAARAADVSRRQLGRWFQEHAGLSPKSWQALERLQASVQAVQRRQGDPGEGYSDQAHQTRAWKKLLGLTPGAYRRRATSVLAQQAAQSAPTGPAFWL